MEYNLSINLIAVKDLILNVELINLFLVSFLVISF